MWKPAVSIAVAIFILTACGSEDPPPEPAGSGAGQDSGSATVDPETIAEIDAQAAEAEALAELESLMSGSDSLTAYDTDCAVGAVFAIGDGCVVEGVGHFYVEDDGQGGSLGTFSTDAWPDAEGYSTISTSTSEIKVDEYSTEPDDQFGAINNEDGTWTVTALP